MKGRVSKARGYSNAADRLEAQLEQAAKDTRIPKDAIKGARSGFWLARRHEEGLYSRWCSSKPRGGKIDLTRETEEAPEPAELYFVADRQGEHIDRTLVEQQIYESVEEGERRFRREEEARLLHAAELDEVIRREIGGMPPEAPTLLAFGLSDWEPNQWRLWWTRIVDSTASPEAQLVFKLWLKRDPDGVVEITERFGPIGRITYRALRKQLGAQGVRVPGGCKNSGNDYSAAGAKLLVVRALVEAMMAAGDTAPNLSAAATKKVEADLVRWVVSLTRRKRISSRKKAEEHFSPPMVH